ncbi:hypothetical protein [Brasilonema bromeliae]|uniref:Uncharacterized protein n=1 Tax=Brasilonema bromeliae SPC951 TaxID=385972 RepID=A0ABX1P4J7_9CYAN|nr:hypothetical protein [Brasilonema bromeliae]NMG18545.1 hypothetical protein [Brasilonema bromeliae SPC951]
MKLNYQNNNIFTFVKVLSTVLITSAIGLELWNIYAVLTHTKVPSSLNPVFWIERFAVTIHFLEAVVAAFFAPSRKKTPLKYGTYTFFVGTIGLLELFNKEDD